jgi:hypothetical protein
MDPLTRPSSRGSAVLTSIVAGRAVQHASAQTTIARTHRDMRR